MKIAIDVSQIVHGGGVSDYTKELVKGLARNDRDHDYLLFGFSARRLSKLRVFGNEIDRINRRFKTRFWPIPISLVENWGNRFRWPEIEKIIGPVDLYHSSDWVQFPAKAKKVTTVHDFSFYKYPQSASPKIFGVMSRRLSHVGREVDGIIAVSKATAQAGSELACLSMEKITVIYEAADPEFLPASGAQINTIKDKLELAGPYFVVPANLDPRKNTPRVLEAYSIFSKKRTSWTLVVTGLPGWNKIPKPNSGRVVLAGFLPYEEYRALMTGSRGLIYPSLDEGFGQPILEAMQMGVPVLTSNLSSMPEVAGRAAVLVNPTSVVEIAHGMEQLVTERERLIRAGFAQAKKFSWDKAARETKAFYEKIYAQKK